MLVGLSRDRTRRVPLCTAPVRAARSLASFRFGWALTLITDHNVKMISKNTIIKKSAAIKIYLIMT
jgi:hypothetical protein